jgi:hypothetical protein
MNDDPLWLRVLLRIKEWFSGSGDSGGFGSFSADGSSDSGGSGDGGGSGD